uniref:Uncharacterized protein n=1 Tax=Oryza sativa subsp. japonica TaxID=39947 RepID=Q947Z7_ORYSJ|nr:Hypothetical protein [Oryza sativa Japonica Group]
MVEAATVGGGDLAGGREGRGPSGGGVGPSDGGVSSPLSDSPLPGQRWLPPPSLFSLRRRWWRRRWRRRWRWRRPRMDGVGGGHRWMTWWRPRMDGVATTEGGGGNGRGPRWRWPMADPAEGEKSFVM